MYNLVYSKEALKQLKKLDKNARVRILSTLERARIRPHSHVKKLVESSFFRLRTGKYRVIIDIKENKLIVYVIEVGHRRNIYK